MTDGEFIPTTLGRFIANASSRLWERRFGEPPPVTAGIGLTMQIILNDAAGRRRASEWRGASKWRGDGSRR